MCIELVETSGEYEFQFDHDQGESDTTGAAGQCISGCCQQDIRQVQCSYCFFLFFYFLLAFCKTLHFMYFKRIRVI